MVNGSHYADSPLLKPTGVRLTINKLLAPSDHPETSETYPHQDDAFGYELQRLLSRMRSVI